MPAYVKEEGLDFNFDELIERRSSGSVKWDVYDEDVLPLWIADMDFRAPTAVIQALQERAAHGIFGYTLESPRLREQIVARMKALYDWEVRPEEIVFIPGVVVGFNQAAQALARPGEGVLIQTPIYPPFLEIGAHGGLLSQYAPLARNEDGEYGVDLNAFEEVIDNQTRVFVLCNPHNPVGRVFSRRELEGMAEICARHGVWIVSDEIHSDLIFSGHKHIPIASLDGEISRRTITLMAPSKTYNIPGLECSFAIIQDESVREHFQGGRRGLVGGVNLLGLAAAEAAYSQGQGWLDAVMLYLEGNRDYLFDFVRTELLGVHMAKPEGTYLAWLDCHQAGIEGDPGQFFLERAKVALNEGKTFGPGGEAFVRLNFATPRRTLEQALQRMKAALQSL